MSQDQSNSIQWTDFSFLLNDDLFQFFEMDKEIRISLMIKIQIFSNGFKRKS